MKNFKKVIAVLCSATMILGSTVTAFATETHDTTAGAGNILVFSVETVTLPTSVKVAFNPNGYNVTPKDGAAAVTSQIVSLKYGIASASNKDKDVTVSFTATGAKASGHNGKGSVVFVDTIEETQAYDETNNPTGAKYGEYKIYLAVAGSAAAPQKTSGAFAVTDFADADAIAATKTALADASFTAAEKGLAVFSGNATKAESAIAYKLDKATYEQKQGTDGTIDFSTTQSDMASKFSMKALGTNGVVGFTFTGGMNANADWTQAEITSLSIQPEYEIVDADGSEEAEETGSGNGQIKIVAAATTSALSSNTISKSSGGDITVTGKTVSNIKLYKDGNVEVAGVAGTHYTVSGSKYTFTASVLSNKVKITFNFSDGTSEDVTVQ
jgi:hypothetical protein